MVWTSLFQLVYPISFFVIREAKVWTDLNGSGTSNTDWKRDHYTAELDAWEKIVIGHSIVWGPMFLLGLLGLSDVLRLTNSRLIEHYISNLHIPMYLVGTVLLLTVAADSSYWLDWLMLGLYASVSAGIGAITMQ